MPLRWPFKDPDEVLDYQIDWSERLDDDSIVASSWIVPVGITSNSDSNTDTTATIWLAGGSLNQNYELLNRIVTSGGRTMDETVFLPIKSR